MKGYILIIDDDCVIARATSKMLMKRGFQVVVENNGDEGLKKIKQSQFDVILLDIKMPIMSGIEVLGEIRKYYNKNVLPVIMCSSCDEDKDVVEALKLGANDYIVKPANIDILLARIYTQIDIRRLSLELARKCELEAVTAMIATYNHEINNILTMSFSEIRQIKKENFLPVEVLDRLQETQKRIRDVVKKIDKVSEDSDINYEEYCNNTKMIKIS